jgi:hypothetical protein
MPAHTAPAMQDLIATFGWEQFDLGPSNFHMFLHLKTFLGGRRFHDEVKEAVNTWFASQVAFIL